MPSSSSDIEAELARQHEACAGWALSCCRWDRAEADDVLQASYLKALDGRARFDGASSFRTWIFGVIRRTAAEYRRRRAIAGVFRTVSLDAVAERADAAESAGERLERSQRTEALVAALRQLPTRQREVLMLVFYESMSIAEAAVVMRVSVGTARTHYERGKARLRELLVERSASSAGPSVHPRRTP